MIFSELLQKRYPKDSFIAHIGGDDFFVGLRNYEFKKVFDLTDKVQIEFKNSVENLYSKKDKDKGLLIAKDRFNIERSFNLLSVSSAIIEINPNSNISNFDSTLNVLKKASKGSSKPISSIL